MATGLEMSDDALGAELIVAGWHIRRFQHLRTVLGELSIFQQAAGGLLLTFVENKNGGGGGS